MKARHFILAMLALLALGCNRAEREEPRNPRVVRTYPATGVKKVIVRAAGAETAEIATDPSGEAIEISGEPTGGAAGYHSPDPNWKETPARDWGLDFVSRAHSTVLVISSKSEIQYIHHGYWLRDVKVRVPSGVEVVCEKRQLSGDGNANLAPPAP